MEIRSNWIHASGKEVHIRRGIATRGRVPVGTLEQQVYQSTTPGAARPRDTTVMIPTLCFPTPAKYEATFTNKETLGILPNANKIV
ncbi:hypothetical protein E2C01_039665 [Portunus trituberculatus]|uniref:Uncharacterized protein n=1 Tax=Portunus trituberculatus TaxID=210409 RepID=A0A5B7FLC1_PORTR|nr:hypothetical protein [Portunus trituberculatus]